METVADDKDVSFHETEIAAKVVPIHLKKHCPKVTNAPNAMHP